MKQVFEYAGWMCVRPTGHRIELSDRGKDWTYLDTALAEVLGDDYLHNRGWAGNVTIRIEMEESE